MPMFRRSKKRDIKPHSVRDVYSVHDVFTPTTPAKLNYVQRPSLDSQLADALRTPGKQLVVYGESGSGKTTLLRNKLAELHYEHISTPCSAAMSYEQLLLDAFDQLNPYYIQNTESKRARSISPGVEADFKAIRLRLDATVSDEAGEVRARVLPPQLTPQRLAAFLGELEMCWVIEDFHKIREDQKTLYSQCLKVFSDLGDKYRKTKTITVGATETARQVVQYDPEMRRRVSELLVPLMEYDELLTILSNGRRLLNVGMAPEAEDMIIGYSAGMPSICHQIALNVCVVKGIHRTQSSKVLVSLEDLQPGMERYVAELSDTIKFAFDRAKALHQGSRTSNSRTILAALAFGPVSGMSLEDISVKMAARSPKYPKANLEADLMELTQESSGSIVRHGVGGTYRFSEPIYHTYAKMTLTEAPEPVSTGQESVSPAYRVRDQARTMNGVITINGQPVNAQSVWYSSTPIEIVAAKSIFDHLGVEPKPWNIVTQEDLRATFVTIKPSRATTGIYTVRSLDSQATTRESNAAQEDHD